MRLSYPKKILPNPLPALRQAGYSYFIDPKSREESYVLRLGADFYPRFHLYLDNKDDLVVFDLHLDQKQPSYKGAAMHAGEYDGKTVEEEAKRLDGWVRYVVTGGAGI